MSDKIKLFLSVNALTTCAVFAFMIVGLPIEGVFVALIMLGILEIFTLLLMKIIDTWG